VGFEKGGVGPVTSCVGSEKDIMGSKQMAWVPKKVA